MESLRKCLVLVVAITAVAAQRFLQVPGDTWQDAPDTGNEDIDAGNLQKDAAKAVQAAAAETLADVFSVLHDAKPAKPTSVETEEKAAADADSEALRSMTEDSEALQSASDADSEALQSMTKEQPAAKADSDGPQSMADVFVAFEQPAHVKTQKQAAADAESEAAGAAIQSLADAYAALHRVKATTVGVEEDAGSSEAAVAEHGSEPADDDDVSESVDEAAESKALLQDDSDQTDDNDEEASTQEANGAEDGADGEVSEDDKATGTVDTSNDDKATGTVESKMAEESGDEDSEISEAHGLQDSESDDDEDENTVESLPASDGDQAGDPDE